MSGKRRQLNALTVHGDPSGVTAAQCSGTASTADQDGSVAKIGDELDLDLPVGVAGRDRRRRGVSPGALTVASGKTAERHAAKEVRLHQPGPR